MPAQMCASGCPSAPDRRCVVVVACRVMRRSVAVVRDWKLVRTEGDTDVMNAASLVKQSSHTSPSPSSASSTCVAQSGAWGQGRRHGRGLARPADAPPAPSSAGRCAARRVPVRASRTVHFAATRAAFSDMQGWPVDRGDASDAAGTRTATEECHWQVGVLLPVRGSTAPMSWARTWHGDPRVLE